MAQEGTRVYQVANGYVVWGTVLGVVDDGRLMIAWDEGNPLGWEADFGVDPATVGIQIAEEVA